MMRSKKQVLIKIGGIITDITEQYGYLAKNVADINELEMELFMANTTFLANHVAILQRLVKDASQTTVKQTSTKKYDPVVRQDTSNPSSLDTHPERADQNEGLQEQKPAKTQSEVSLIPISNTENQDPTSNIQQEQGQIAGGEDVKIPNWQLGLRGQLATSFDFEKKNVDELYDRPLTSAEKQVITQKMKTDESVSSAPTAKSNVAKKAIATGATINDRHKQVVTDQLSKHAAIVDLKAMISLNDKLLFIKDLFNGYGLAYGEAIDRINQLNTMEEVEHFLQANYSKKNDWATKQSVVDKFYKILVRRFSKG